jgi:hypothetical protein
VEGVCEVHDTFLRDARLDPIDGDVGGEGHPSVTLALGEGVLSFQNNIFCGVKLNGFFSIVILILWYLDIGD